MIGLILKFLIHSEAKYVLFITKNQPVAHQPGTALNTIDQIVFRFVDASCWRMLSRARLNNNY